jgi:GT2 family glycosyltransferase
MSGLVGIISNDAGRFSLFSSCVARLIERGLPPGSKVEWLIGGDWCGARNDLVRQALDEEWDWLWFMDDDHAFAPNLLNRLLSHGLPLVMPFCLQRVYPFWPVSFTEPYGYPINPNEYEEELVEIKEGGCAGMLIRSEVLRSIPEPWFEYTDRSEDVIFCEKAREAGFSIHVDLGAQLGHITTAVVWPAKNEDGWATGFTIGHELKLYTPFALREEVAA